MKSHESVGARTEETDGAGDHAETRGDLPGRLAIHIHPCGVQGDRLHPNLTRPHDPDVRLPHVAPTVDQACERKRPPGGFMLHDVHVYEFTIRSTRPAIPTEAMFRK